MPQFALQVVDRATPRTQVFDGEQVTKVVVAEAMKLHFLACRFLCHPARQIAEPRRHVRQYAAPLSFQNTQGLPMYRGCRSMIASAAFVSGTTRSLSPLPFLDGDGALFAVDRRVAQTGYFIQTQAGLACESRTDPVREGRGAGKTIAIEAS